MKKREEKALRRIRKKMSIRLRCRLYKKELGQVGRGGEFLALPGMRGARECGGGGGTLTWAV